ncbi:MAG: radical SAM/SPASM domain-containing protein [Thermodesulfobacteriota bacterium]|nr:radical SAM/SPASM domain-containing protein [Thermodesulfobacteriota bacterium]
MPSLSCDAGASNPHYQTIQIELTNRCDLSCKTCLRAIPDIDLLEQDLGKSALQRLEPALKHTASVHLQGWGEPMLLTDLPERIRWFKIQKCKVSFTTSGSLMTARQAAELVACGLDAITFSMAGATAQVQDGLRGQGTHAKLWQSMRLLKKAKENQGSATPALAVSYLLTNESINELPLAVQQCRPLGLSLFAGVHLTHAATDKQKAMRLYSSYKKQCLKQLVRRAHWHAFWGGMRLQLPVFQSDLTPVCDKNPLNRCFIAADGSVAPCVFLYTPAAAKQKEWFTDSGRLPAPQKSFGSLSQYSLDQIWQKSEYRAFRKAFRQRLEIYEKEIEQVGLGMDATEKLDRARSRIRIAFLSKPVPECCRNCPKVEGF